MGYGATRTAPFNRLFEGIPGGQLTKAGGSMEVGATTILKKVNCVGVAISVLTSLF